MPDDAYNWLVDETNVVKTNKFFTFSHAINHEAIKNAETELGQLPTQFKAFITRFGDAALFRVMTDGWYHMTVSSKVMIFENDRGDRAARVGHYKGGDAYFLKTTRENVLGAGVYEGYPYRLRKSADTFNEWLVKRFSSCKKFYNKTQWKQIVEGPPPFSEEELSILQAIPKFTFENVGIAENGDLQIKVYNGSDTRLNRLTIGVFVPKRLIGAVWLKVSDVGPGETKIVEQGVYKDIARPEFVQLNRMELPDPSERRMFREFDGFCEQWFGEARK